ncbi:MAG TPA: DUF2254 domain-containing protein [Gemmataceae bacterium]|nr:DUF2254 domain-containing protein [Gemmataceae bacterium]
MRRTLRTSLVLWGVLALVAALVVAPAVRWVDERTGWKIFGFNPEGARSLLGVLVGSMLTFIVFVLSATLIVVQLASGQSTPRVVALVLASPAMKVALGTLTFTFAFTLAALSRIDDRVPDFHVGVAVILNLICIVVFLEFVQRLSGSLRPAALIQLVATHAHQVFNDVYPSPFDADRTEPTIGEPVSKPASTTDVPAHRSGVVIAFGASELVRLAEKGDAVVELVPQVGDFVAIGEPLFRVASQWPTVSADSLRDCVVIGPERTLVQDPRFVFRILVDIASKALSPGINDPTTAVQALDQIQHLLHVLGRRHLDEGRLRGPTGNVRLIYGTPDWTDFVLLAVSEVRHFGAGSLQVARRLRATLEHLLEVLPEDRRPPLREELALLNKAVERHFADEVDRRRAGVADFQGVGGSES